MPPQGKSYSADYQRQRRLDLGITKKSTANPKLAKRLMDHTSEVAAHQTAEIKAITQDIVCSELDKRFPDTLLERPGDSEKAKSIITKAKKRIHEVEVQRCRDADAAMRAAEGKPPLGRKRPRSQSSLSSKSQCINATVDQASVEYVEGSPVTGPIDSSPAEHAEPIDLSPAEQVNPTDLGPAEQVSPINLGPVELNEEVSPTEIDEEVSPTEIEEEVSPTEINEQVCPTEINDESIQVSSTDPAVNPMDLSSAEQVLAVMDTTKVIQNEPHMRLPAYMMHYNPQVETHARDIYPCKAHLNDEQFCAYWTTELYTGMIRLEQHMSFHDAVDVVMQDIGKLAFATWVVPQHSASPGHWMKWLERVASEVDRQGLDAFKSIITRHGLYQIPPKRSVSVNEQFALKIIDLANLVQALGGDRHALRKAEKQLQSNLYERWPGIGTDMATEDFNTYILWLFEVRSLIIDDISLIEKVLAVKGFRLAPVVR